VLGEGLALDEDREQPPAPGVDEALAPEEPSVDVVEHQARPGRQLDELPALGRDLILPTEGLEHLVSEGQGCASARHSPVDRPEFPELDPDHRDVEPCRE